MCQVTLAPLSLTRTLALDHATENIRAVSLSPGAVMTSRIIDQAGSEEAAEAAFAPLHPVGRVGRVEEMASVALFLVSDAAGFVTGIPGQHRSMVGNR